MTNEATTEALIIQKNMMSYHAAHDIPIVSKIKKPTAKGSALHKNFLTIFHLSYAIALFFQLVCERIVPQHNLSDKPLQTYKGLLNCKLRRMNSLVVIQYTIVDHLTKTVFNKFLAHTLVVAA